ncbi:MAG: portal protein [Nitrospirales bacterium]
MPSHTVDEILTRLDQLITARKNWDNHWQEISELIWPMAADFITKREPGIQRSDRIFDATGALALEKFAAVLESLLTPRAQKWHRLKATDEELNKDASVKKWFEEATDILFKLRDRPNANYYAQKHEGYKSLGAFGNDCLFIDEMEPTAENPEAGIRYKYCHIGQIYIAVNHHGQVDTIYRKYPMSAKAIHQQWGAAAVPPKIASALQPTPFKPFELLHLVQPRNERNPDLIDPLNKPFRSVYIGIEDRMIIDEGGFDELPYMYSRYTINPFEMHGRSPAMLVLPSIRMSQDIQRTFIRAGHKVVDPPLLVPDAGRLGTGTQEIRLQPGGINYGGVDSRGNPMIVPLQTGARLDLTEGMLEKERAVINAAFLADVFDEIRDVQRTNPQMTATEVIVRNERMGRRLAPMVGRQQTEMLGPQIIREVGIALRNGLLPELPGLLVEAEGKYEIVYESDATRFQKASQLQGTDRTLERVVLVGQFDPTAFDIIKGDEVIRLSQEVEGAPTSILRTKEELKQLRDQRSQEEALQKGLDVQAQVASAQKDAAQAQAAAPGAAAVSPAVTGGS